MFLGTFYKNWSLSFRFGFVKCLGSNFRRLCWFFNLTISFQFLTKNLEMKKGKQVKFMLVYVRYPKLQSTFALCGLPVPKT